MTPAVAHAALVRRSSSRRGVDAGDYLERAMDWKTIETAPRSIGESYIDVIVGYEFASVWIVRSAFYRSAQQVKELAEKGLDFDADDAGWWSYRNSVTQEMVYPTHWLCEVPEHPE